MYVTSDGTNSQLCREFLAYLASESEASAPPLSSPVRTAHREGLRLMTDDDSKFVAHTEFYGRMRMAFFQS
ncbi:MAG TPA: hypothetical protein VEH76_08385 [Methylocystis sp.]|nr:hypothetical protein [Methylocystis sp.]